MTQPLLSIVTRHISSRAAMFERLALSIVAQDCKHWEHIVIYNEPLGLEDANQSFERDKSRVNGKYVFMVDDDNYIVNPNFVAQLWKHAENNPAVIMVRAQWFDSLVPLDVYWDELIAGGKPHLGHIDTANFVVRRDIWLKYIKAFGAPVAGDYAFISAIYEGEPDLDVVYWDTVIVAIDHVGSKQVGSK